MSQRLYSFVLSAQNNSWIVISRNVFYSRLQSGIVCVWNAVFIPNDKLPFSRNQCQNENMKSQFIDCRGNFTGFKIIKPKRMWVSAKGKQLDHANSLLFLHVIPDWLYVRIGPLWQPCHLLQDSLHLLRLKIILYSSGWKAGLVDLLQN